MIYDSVVVGGGIAKTLQNWDYGWNAAYFVTICTQNRENYFGHIVYGKMHMSEIGQMAEKFWHEIPQHYPFVKSGPFVVMPNHVHGIIIIDKPETQNFASLPYPANPANPVPPVSPAPPTNPNQK